MNHRTLIPLAWALVLAACGRGGHEQFDHVRSFKIDWEHPQSRALAWALDTCAIWGTDPTIAGPCLRRRDEARELLDAVVTCQQNESADYPACVRVRAWAGSVNQDLAQFEKLSGSTGRAEDLADLRAVARPANQFIAVLWTAEDRSLALRRHAWKGWAATLIGLLLVAAGIRRLLAHAQHETATAIPANPAPVSTPELAMEPTTSTEVQDELAPLPIHEIEKIGIQTVIENEDIEPAIPAEEAAEAIRKEAKAAARRAAAEAAQREFDQIKNLF